jgi:uncharacterized protein
MGQFSETEQNVIDQVSTVIQKQFAEESTGHDWYHIQRVFKNALLIAAKEKANYFLVGLAALLHDIADHKFEKNPDEMAQVRIKALLSELEVEEAVIDKVVYIVQNVSYKGGLGAKMGCIEGLIVQDADRLDAIGAIGIARTFAFGGKFNRAIYDPKQEAVEFNSIDEYKRSNSHTINHFYEKLLKLKDGMHTEAGKELAKERHEFMEQFLRQFYAEWDGKR